MAVFDGSNRIASRNIRLQAWVNFCAGLTFLIPVITLFYTTKGLTLFQVVIVANVASLFVWLLELPTSVFADTVGRTRSLRWSALSNLCGAFVILLFPGYPGFLIASVCGALYMSFWSGTGQAFLADNLALLNRSHEYGRVIGHYMFMEQAALFMTPFVASAILYGLGDSGFWVLALLDVLSATLLMFFVVSLRALPSAPPHRSWIDLWKANVLTASDAFHSVLSNARVRLLLIYRSLANHVAFLPLMILPILSQNGMPTWVAGIVTALAALAAMTASRYACVLGERTSYNLAWILATAAQAILLIAAGLLLSHWLLLAAVFVLFSFFEGIWQPSWNHVLVEETRGHAVATTRSIIFGTFALYTTLGKQFLSFFPLPLALIGLGVFILFVNAAFSTSLLRLHATKQPPQPLTAA